MGLPFPSVLICFLLFFFFFFFFFKVKKIIKKNGYTVDENNSDMNTFCSLLTGDYP